MATQSIQKLDGFTVAASSESQNREREQARDFRRKGEKNKLVQAAPAPVQEAPAEELQASQIVDSSTVVELLSHRPTASGQARFLVQPPSKAPALRQKAGGKKLDKTA